MRNVKPLGTSGRVGAFVGPVEGIGVGPGEGIGVGDDEGRPEGVPEGRIEGRPEGVADGASVAGAKDGRLVEAVCTERLSAASCC
jgi:hypothetical protein